MPRLTPPRDKRLRSPLARAIIPVLAGIGFFVLLGLATWAAAAWIASSSQPTERLAPVRLDLGSAQGRADDVADDGPLLFADLETVDGARSLVLDHRGVDAYVGWRLYYAYPAGRPDCPISQIVGTATFLDCDGVEIGVEDLAPPTEDVRPVVDDGALYLDLRAFSDGSTTADSDGS